MTHTSLAPLPLSLLPFVSVVASSCFLLSLTHLQKTNPLHTRPFCPPDPRLDYRRGWPIVDPTHLIYQVCAPFCGSSVSCFSSFRLKLPPSRLSFGQLYRNEHPPLANNKPSTAQQKPKPSYSSKHRDSLENPRRINDRQNVWHLRLSPVRSRIAAVVRVWLHFGAILRAWARLSHTLRGVVLAATKGLKTPSKDLMRLPCLCKTLYRSIELSGQLTDP